MPREPERYEQPEIWVKVSQELLAQLHEWSAPVQAMIVESGTARPGEPKYDMIFRTVPDEEPASE